MGPIVLTGGPQTLQLASDTFKCGGVLLYPTSTLYGLGGDPLDSSLSKRIHAIKGTSPSKPHLLLTDEWDRCRDWMTGVSDLHARVMDAAEGLPITILFHASPGAPAHLVGPSGMIAIRRTRHPFCRLLIASIDSVLTSTSANRTQVAPPAAFEEIDPKIIEEVDISISGGRSSGLPSTMVSIEGEQVVVHRIGATSQEALAARLELTKE